MFQVCVRACVCVCVCVCMGSWLEVMMLAEVQQVLAGVHAGSEM